MKPTDKSGIDYLSPNSLLLGRIPEIIATIPFQAEELMTNIPRLLAQGILLIPATDRHKLININNGKSINYNHTFCKRI